MPRTVDEDVIEQLSARVLRVEYLWLGIFQDTTIKLWTGIGDLTVGEHTYTGNGWLTGFPVIRESLGGSTDGLSVSLTGIPDNILTIALNQVNSSGSCEASIAFFDKEDALITTAPLFLGKLDRVEVLEDPERSSVRFAYNSRLARIKTPRELRWTNEQQQIEYPGDRFMEYVEFLKNQRLFWGREDTSRL